jgi:hypothetical protein
MTVELLDVISDPYNGPEEGVDFWIDECGYVQVPYDTPLVAGKILKLANSSGLFDKKLVKLGVKGDSILLGFDELIDVPAVFTAKIGFKDDNLAEIKQDTKKFYVYFNGKRSNRTFTTLGKARAFVRKLDKELKAEAVEPEDIDN